MNSLALFHEQNYLNLETFRRSGEALHTPVWFVHHGQLFYIRTIAGSGKVRRIRNNPHVQVAPCGREGQLLGPWIPAHGREVVGDSALEAEVDRLLDVKYGELKRQLARQAAGAGQVYTILEVKLDE